MSVCYNVQACAGLKIVDYLNFNLFHCSSVVHQLCFRIKVFIWYVNSGMGGGDGRHIDARYHLRLILGLGGRRWRQ